VSQWKFNPLARNKFPLSLFVLFPALNGMNAALGMLVRLESMLQISVDALEQ
jgi:hypothetical protein